MRGGAAEAPVVEEGTDGVRIMTVHSAKGLEFPVVILVDPTAPATLREPFALRRSRRGSLWAMPLAGCIADRAARARDEVLRHDREEAHAPRLRGGDARARSARGAVVGDAIAGEEATSGWLDALLPVVFPRVDDRRSAQAAPGCPPFGRTACASGQSRHVATRRAR